MSEISTLSTLVTVADSVNEISTLSTLVTGPEPIGPIAPAILSLQDLLNDHSLIVQKEATDKEAVLLFFDRNIEALRPKLLEWATAGLPAGFRIDTIEVNPPARCSDGVARDLLAYIQYVANMELPDLLLLTQNKLSNITLLYSFSANKLTLHCSASS